jgi:hypothetical protein
VTKGQGALVKAPPRETALVVKENRMARDSHAVSIESDQSQVVGVPMLRTTGLVFQVAGSESSGRPPRDPRRPWVRRLGSARPSSYRREES